MEFLTRVFGPPHESLHILALYLIGRRPKAVSKTHVDIPDDLALPHYIFVAGLPAFVFWNMAIAGIIILVNAPNIAGVALGWLLLMVGGMAGFGTIGDIQLIYVRIQEDQKKPPGD